MRMISNVSLALLGVLILFAAVQAYAGEWIEGRGKTIKEAHDNAMQAAESKVEARGKGCIGGNSEGSNVAEPVKVSDEEWMVRVFISHHNGSCKKGKFKFF